MDGKKRDYASGAKKRKLRKEAQKAENLTKIKKRWAERDKEREEALAQTTFMHTRRQYFQPS